MTTANPIYSTKLAAAPAFCPGCGYAWAQGATECRVCRHTAHCRTGARIVIEPPVAETGRQGGLSPLRSALALFVVLVAICLCGGLVGSLGYNPAQCSLAMEALISIVVITWAAQSKRSESASLFSMPNPDWFAIAIGLSFVTFTVATLVIALVRGVAHLPAANGSSLFIQQGYGWGVVVLLIAVQPAVIEELAFRGVILGSLRQTLSTGEAVVVSSVMFMVLHLSVARFPHTLALGLAAGMLRTRSRSILPCMLLHFCHNLMCVLMEWAGR